MKNITSSVYTFEDIVKDDFLYVDKTEFIWNLIRQGKAMYFLSRPRRFGKSLTVSTLKAVFQGKKELFKELAIYDKPYDWKQYPVIHLDMNGLDFSSVEELESSLCDLVTEAAASHADSVGHLRVGLTESCDKTKNRVLLSDTVFLLRLY